MGGLDWVSRGRQGRLPMKTPAGPAPVPSSPPFSCTPLSPPPARGALGWAVSAQALGSPVPRPGHLDPPVRVRWGLGSCRSRRLRSDAKMGKLRQGTCRAAAHGAGTLRSLGAREPGPRLDRRPPEAAALEPVPAAFAFPEPVRGEGRIPGSQVALGDGDRAGAGLPFWRRRFQVVCRAVKVPPPACERRGDVCPGADGNSLGLTSRCLGSFDLCFL